MDIQAQLEIPITPAEAEQLGGTLHIDPENLHNSLGPIITAATREYIRMILGQKVFTRGSDMLEYRLFLMIRHVFENTIPDEQTVCDLFQITTSRSRSLIRSVISKYQYELREAVNQSLLSIVQDAVQPVPDGDFEVTINNITLVDELNQRLASQDGTLPHVGKKRRTVSRYTIRPSAYECLLNDLGE